MTVTVERRTARDGWSHAWGVTCHPAGEGLDGVTWTWTVVRSIRTDPPEWHAYPPCGLEFTPPALARWQRAVIEAVVNWERGEAAEGRP